MFLKQNVRQKKMCDIEMEYIERNERKYLCLINTQ